MRHKITIRIMYVMLSAGCFVFENAAAEAQLNRITINIPERGEVLAYVVSVETNHFQFIPPPQWQVSKKPGGTAVVMMASGLASSITIDFIDGPSVRGRQKNRHEKLIAERYPSATSLEKFKAQTGLGQGTASDIDREAGDGLRVRSRVVHVRAGSAVIEFTLTAPGGQFSAQTTAFAGLINSFQATVPERR